MDEICTGNEAIHWNVFRELGLILNDIIMCAMDWNVFGNEYYTRMCSENEAVHWNVFGE